MLHEALSSQTLWAITTVWGTKRQAENDEQVNSRKKREIEDGAKLNETSNLSDCLIADSQQQTMWIDSDTQDLNDRIDSKEETFSRICANTTKAAIKACTRSLCIHTDLFINYLLTRIE